MADLVDINTPTPPGYERVEVSSQMGMLLNQLPEKQAEMLLYNIKEDVKVFKSNAELVGREENLRRIYETTDKALEHLGRINKSKPSCRKGCAFCCKMEVMCGRIEAEYALAASEKADGPMIEDELELLRNQVEIHSQGSLAYALSPHATCVFLTEDNECSIYEQRPIACRNYQVINDPALCDIVKYPRHDVIVIAYIQTEGMRSILINAEPYKLLPEHILDIYKEREQWDKSNTTGKPNSSKPVSK